MYYMYKREDTTPAFKFRDIELKIYLIFAHMRFDKILNFYSFPIIMSFELLFWSLEAKFHSAISTHALRVENTRVD